MAKAVATRSVDLEPIDRLEEKVKLLVGMVERLRGDNAGWRKRTRGWRASSTRARRG